MTPLFIIEPGLLSSCDQVDSLYTSFGIANAGRLLGLHPHNQIELFNKKINEELNLMCPIKMTRKIEKIHKLQKLSVKNFFPFNSGYSWHEMTRALLANNLADTVLKTEEELEEIFDKNDGKGIMSVRVNASQENLAHELCNLFKYSSWLTIVDPYFINDIKRFKLIAALVKAGELTRKCKNIKILVGYNDYYKELVYKKVVTHYDKGNHIKKMYAELFDDIKQYVNIHFIIVDDQGMPDVFHERVVLSNLGGMRFDKGFDIKPTRLETISCMHESDYLEMHEKYDTLLRNNTKDVVILKSKT